MYIVNKFSTGVLYQKPKIFTILKLDHVKNTKDHLNFVLILSLAI